MLACDMYAMQFMEVAYELRGVLDLLVGIQPDDSENAGPLAHWPYARLPASAGRRSSPRRSRTHRRVGGRRRSAGT